MGDGSSVGGGALGGVGVRARPLRLLLVRHGESEANSERRMQGRLDSPLTARGRRQAGAIARRVVVMGPIDALYASPLQRALGTAEAIGREAGLRPVILPELMETDIGEATGLSWEEFERRHAELAREIQAGAPDARWPGGESRRQLAERAATAIEDVASRHPEGGTAVVVSHGGTLRWVVAHLMAGTPLAHADHRFDNCAITEVVLGVDGPLIACANDSSHLAEIEQEEAHTDQVP